MSTLKHEKIIKTPEGRVKIEILLTLDEWYRIGPDKKGFSYDAIVLFCPKRKRTFIVDYSKADKHSIHLAAIELWDSIKPSIED